MSKISVLVPAYNTGLYIEKCIESIQNQTYTNIDIIVVDDGSTDGTVEIACHYAESDARIKVISTIHKGVAEARNECLRNATGDYILFVDSDDWIAPSLCENLYHEAKRTSADIVFSAMISVSSDGTEVLFGDRSIAFQDTELLTGPDCFIRMVDAGCAYPMVAGNLYRKSLFEKNDIVFKGEYHEDEYSFPFLLKNAEKVCSIAEPQYYYRQRPKSIMNCDSNFKERAVALGEIASQFEKDLLTCDASLIHRRFVSGVSRHTSIIKKKARALYDTYIANSDRPLVLLLTEKSISSNYGIGTYLRYIAESSTDSPWDCLQIELNAYDKSEQEFSVKDGVPCYTFPARRVVYSYEKDDCIKKYQYCVFSYLASRLGNSRKLICHVNAYGYDYIAFLFKTRFEARIIFTVHYMDWAFRLNGNRDQLEHILKAPAITPEETLIKEAFTKERLFFNDCCDYVIAIAKHSYDTLHQLYNIPREKLLLIYNSTPNSPNISLSKVSLRDKYGFAQTDKIVIFAGRIDWGKGIFELVQAFKQVAVNNADLKLIIAGDGAYSSLYTHIKPMWSRILLTGYVDKETLFELYSLSDLGIVPSLHEEFGYVAVEMASVGLPVVVNPKGGLKEIAHKISSVTILNHDELNHDEECDLIDSISKVLTTFSTSLCKEYHHKSSVIMSNDLEITYVYHNLFH